MGYRVGHGAYGDGGWIAGKRENLHIWKTLLGVAIVIFLWGLCGLACTYWNLATDFCHFC